LKKFFKNFEKFLLSKNFSKILKIFEFFFEKKISENFRENSRKSRFLGGCRPQKSRFSRKKIFFEDFSRKKARYSWENFLKNFCENFGENIPEMPVKNFEFSIFENFKN